MCTEMHVKYITLQDEVLRDRIQEHINCVEGDIDALWDGEIYCVKHSSPYDLILKMWHELDIIESNSGETTTLKYYSFFLVHKACVLDGAFRSLKLQNAIGIERTSVLYMFQYSCTVNVMCFSCVFLGSNRY